jgi:nucleotide-binding universal stress UspA family protein
MKKILVPIDFSDYSMHAVEVASYIAKVRECKIRLLHIVEDSYTPYYNMVGIDMVEHSTLFTYQKELQESIKRQLSELSEKIKKKDIEVEFEVVLERAKNVIVKEAEDQAVELIVMGSHGHSDVEEIFIGGTSEKVIRTSSIPVLTVHEVADNYQIDKIVFASDFEEGEVENILKQVIDFAEIFMAELYLVRINTPSRLFSTSGSRERIEDFAKNFNLSAGAVTSYDGRSEEEGIVSYAKEVGADLIVLGTHGRTGLARLFKGSIAEDVVGNSKIPVLTYNLGRIKNKGSSRPVIKERKLKIDHLKRHRSEE